MPAFIISPLLKIALGALGAGLAIRWLAKEAQRINAEVEQVRGRPGLDPAARGALPTLRRDPRTGDWRVL
jgi:hypothetical protein